MLVSCLRCHWSYVTLYGYNLVLGFCDTVQLGHTIALSFRLVPYITQTHSSSVWHFLLEWKVNLLVDVSF